MHAFRRTVFAVVAAGISLTSAQSISSQCQATLASIVLSSDGQCLNAQALIGVLMAGQNTSLVSPINNWLTGLCAQPACTNDTLATVTANLTTGCPTELGDLGLGNATAPQLTSLVQMAYPTVRQIACLENTKSSTLCVTESLNGIEASNGPLTTGELQTLLTQILGASMPNVPSSVTCSDCSKEMYNLFDQGFPGLMGSNTQNSFTQTCGANFTDGQAPSDVRQTANGATQSNTSGDSTNNNKNGGLPTLDVNAAGVALSSLLTTFSAFALLG